MPLFALVFCFSAIFLHLIHNAGPAPAKTLCWILALLPGLYSFAFLPLPFMPGLRQYLEK